MKKAEVGQAQYYSKAIKIVIPLLCLINTRKKMCSRDITIYCGLVLFPNPACFSTFTMAPTLVKIP